MVTKKPTTRVQIISQSDIMRQGQNYKINKKIWEAIEENNKDNGLNDLISRIETLEAEEYDDSALKQAMGYDDIPENESLQSQIDDLLDEIGDSDTPDSIIARLDELEGVVSGEESRDILITVTDESDVGVSNVLVKIGSIEGTTDGEGQVTLNNVEDGTHTIKCYNDGTVLKYQGEIVTDEESTEQTIQYSQDREIIFHLYDVEKQEIFDNDNIILRLEDVDDSQYYYEDEGEEGATLYIPPVPYRIRAFYNEEEVIVENPILPSSEVEEYTLQLLFDYKTISCKVTLADSGDAVNGEKVEVWNDTISEQKTTGSAGDCTFKLITGEYKAYANTTVSGTRYEKEVTFTVSEDMTLNIALEKGS